MLEYLDDTIVAISTPLGESALAIIRLSGKEAITITEKVFHPVRNLPRCHASQRISNGVRPSKPLLEWPSHTVHYGKIIDPETKEELDEVLVSVFRQPHTYTKEDMVEITTHGGFVTPRRILEVLLHQGARLASPGEFTKRAFLNGRIDLTQAEAVCDLIKAKTERSQKISLQQLEGKFSQKIQSIKDKLLDLLVELEAVIDFPEEEIQPLKNLRTEILKIDDEISSLIKSSQKGLILRDGMRGAIIGRPNVGKSSLFNLLVERERAIVTPIPGTTRDVIEEWIDVDGIPLLLADTAGLPSETKDLVEKEGIKRAQQTISQANLLLLVLDGSEELKEEDKKLLETHFHSALETKTLLIVNKIDLPQKLKKENLKEHTDSVVEISALQGRGIKELNQLILKIVEENGFSEESVVVTNLRHRDILERTLLALKQAQIAVDEKMSDEFVTLDLREALNCLGEITGETSTEEILERIFSQFCIGK
ncbi:MAG: tRNA uridine-5-carboxymethylaminomethyl(34) synthesis GTPase MnmE [Candidatus Edwardsbacteria bacterium]